MHTNLGDYVSEMCHKHLTFLIGGKMTDHLSL